MNREIKFRAWDSNEEEMYVVNSLDIENGNVEAQGDELSLCYRTDIEGLHPEVVLMQYTGLKDKNGKEIYEGDVVKWETGEGWFYEVRFERGEFRGYREGGNLKLWTEERYLEVSGNIYKNPDLISVVAQRL